MLLLSIVLSAVALAISFRHRNSFFADEVTARFKGADALVCAGALYAASLFLLWAVVFRSAIQTQASIVLPLAIIASYGLALWLTRRINRTQKRLPFLFIVALVPVLGPILLALIDFGREKGHGD